MKGGVFRFLCPADITRSATDFVSGRTTPHGTGNERLRLSNLIECPVRAAPGRADSSRRPSPEVPRLYGVSNRSNMKTKPTVHLRAFARTGGVSRNMRKSPCGTFFGSLREQRSKRADMGWGLYFSVLCSESSKAGQYGGSPNDFRSYGSSGMSGLNLFMCATVKLKISAIRRRVCDMRVSISAARPKKIPSGSFLHVSAGRTKSARRPEVHYQIQGHERTVRDTI